MSYLKSASVQSQLKVLSLIFLGLGFYIFYRIVKGVVTVEMGNLKSKDRQSRKRVFIKQAIIGVIAMLMFLPLIISLNIDGAW